MKLSSLFFSFVLLLTPQIASAHELGGSQYRPQDLIINNVRVGQGDSTLILGPQKADGSRITVLFDVGDIPNRDGGNILRTVLFKAGVKKIDHLIISHDDADHIGGIAFGGVHGTSILLGFNNVPGASGDDDGDGIEDWVKGSPLFDPDPEELGLGDDIKVNNFIDYGEELMRDGVQAIDKYNRFANAVGNRTTLNSQADVNDFSIDLGNGAIMTLYAANGYVKDRGTRVAHVNTPNERSLSFLVTYGDFDYLISGDLIGRKSGSENAKVEKAVGQSIVNDGRTVEVLHVNHHGASNGSDPEFLKLIKPKIAIISAGNGNGHKHPTNETLNHLTDAGVDRIIQTSWGTTKSRIPRDVRDHHAIWQQDVIIRSDGTDYWTETSRKWKPRP